MNAPVHFDPASDAATTPLDLIDVSDPRLYQTDIYYPYFERLRREEPVHYRENGMYGSFWSVTKFKDIMAVETRPEIYSSEAKLGGISITDRPMEYRRSSFISMDPPRHDEQRKVVSPIVAPANLNNMEGIILERVCKVPRGETFDWVQRVHRVDHADADHPVRLPTRGARQADLLVRACGSGCECGRSGGLRRKASRNPNGGAPYVHHYVA
jgi:cytochrome P450